MAPVVWLSLSQLALILCLSGGLSGQPARTPSTSGPGKLQQLLAGQQQAVAQGDPAAVIASSQVLIQLALQQLQKVHDEFKHSQPHTAAATKLSAQEHQLLVVLSNTFNDWGTAEAREQRYRDALQHFREAEHWNATTPGLMSNLGTAAFLLEDYKESARTLATAVIASPDDQRLRLMLAMSQFSLEQFEEAAKNFSLVSGPALDDPRSTYAWAYSLVQTNQPQQAAALAGILEGRDLPPNIHLLVCKLYTASSNYDPALKCLRTLQASTTESAELRYEIGATLIRMDRPTDAIDDLRAALKIDPQDVDAQYDLAFALLETSQKEEAITLLRSLLAVNPNYPQAQYQLGKTLLESGQTAEATPYLEAAAKLTPNDDFVHYQLQVAYRRSGRTEDADRELARYKELKAGAREKAADRVTGNQKPQQ